MFRHIVFIPSILILAVTASTADMTSPMDMAARTSILVLPFEAKGRGAPKGSMADDYLIESFARQKRFTIVEREKLEKVLLEQKLTREKLTSPEHSLSIGRLLAADQMLYGRIEEVSGETVVTMRMVATSTSASRDYHVSGEVSGMRGFRGLINEAAAKIIKDFPLLEGKVIRAAGDSYKAEISGSGLRSGLEVIIYRWGDEVRHPSTGKMLGRKVVKIAGGTIAAVEGANSSIKLSKTEKGRTVKEGDLIITR